MPQQQRCEDSEEAYNTAAGTVNTDLQSQLEDVEEVITMEEARQMKRVIDKEVKFVEGARQACDAIMSPALGNSPDREAKSFVLIEDPDALDETLSEGPTIFVASAGAENRHFISLDFLGRSYKALFDPGAMISLIGPTLTDLFSDRLRPCNAVVRGVTGSLARIKGILSVSLDVDGLVGVLPMRAVPTLDYDAIVGVDFCRMWQVEVRFSEGSWRVPGGEWRLFENENSLEDPAIMAECAGISELTDGERALVDELVSRTLPATDAKLGLTHLKEHKIEVTDETPIKHGVRRMSPMMLEIAKEEIHKLVDKGVIEPSDSSWSSAPVMVRKPDGSVRFCIDYRDLNTVTKKDAYPIPNMDSILDKLRRAKYLTTIDLKDAYFQIPMEGNSK